MVSLIFTEFQRRSLHDRNIFSRIVVINPACWYALHVEMKYELCCSGEVTPGLSQMEYELRRYRLASLIEAQADRLGPSASSSTHVVVVLSHPTRYMTNDIPYPFHQNQVSSV